MSAIMNPRMENPRMENPRMENPRLENPRMENPRLENPRLENPRMENPRKENPRMENARRDSFFKKVFRQYSAVYGNEVMQPRGLDGRLPVFVFPQSLTFYTEAPSTHKQILSLYNPYEFRVSYLVLCNNPSCFIVDSPKGFVRAKCYINIVVTRTNLSSSEANLKDRFRIQIFEDGKKKVLGKKDVPAILVSGVPEPHSGSDSDHFESVHAPTRSGGGESPTDVNIFPQNPQQPFGADQGNTGPSIVLIAAAAICLLGLLMPTEGDQTPSRIPSCMHLSANIKIVIAYVLGLLTYAMLRAG